MIMDRLEAMSLLVAAVETGSLSAAGRKLGAPLPTVSRKISELEAHLGTRLLTRSTRSLSLTDAGETYVAACRRILEQVGDAERAAAGEYRTPKGDLVVTAPLVFGRLHVLPVVIDFLATFPDIDVRLSLSDRNVHLIDDHIDLAVRIGPLADSALIATNVGSERRITCGSPAFFARHGIPKSPGDLSDLPVISFDAFAPAITWTFAVPGAKTEITVPIHARLSVNTAEAAVDAAVAGIGVTRVLFYQAARAIAAGTLHPVLAEFEATPTPVNLVHAGQGLLPQKTRAFLDFAAPRIRARHALAGVGVGVGV
jgi:DNA-binding transcriptional LysR family regulator